MKCVLWSVTRVWLLIAIAAATAAQYGRAAPVGDPAFLGALSLLPDSPVTPERFAAVPVVVPWEMNFVDLDAYYGDPAPLHSVPSTEPWRWHLLPGGIVFPSYLASTKEPRLAAQIFQAHQDGWLMDGVLGARVGLVRYGSEHPWLPDGWQIDVEGAAQVRLDIPDNVDVRSSDFRAGLPITYGLGPHRFKFAYYHLSSHVGDEFLLKNPGFRRWNYSRDALVIAYMFYWTDQLRSYAEAGWSFHDDVSEQWEFQFGIDFSPLHPTGIAGAPFFALNAHLREAVNYGGGFTFQAGWAWRGADDTSLLRAGLHYYNGESNQFSFFDDFEEQIGFGVWYDF